MWIMIVTFLFYSDLERGAAIESVEFSSKSTCEAASAAYLADLKPVADTLNADIISKREVGELRGPAGVVISAICVAQ